MSNIQSNTQTASSGSETISESANSFTGERNIKIQSQILLPTEILLRHMKQARRKNQLIDMR